VSNGKIVSKNPTTGEIRSERWRATLAGDEQRLQLIRDLDQWADLMRTPYIWSDLAGVNRNASLV